MEEAVTVARVKKVEAEIVTISGGLVGRHPNPVLARSLVAVWAPGSLKLLVALTSGKCCRLSSVYSGRMLARVNHTASGDLLSGNQRRS